MPAALSCDVPRKLWTREEAHALADLGFPNAEKLELIDGELIDRMGKKHPHVFWHHLVLAWLHAKFGEEYVRTESPIDVATEDNPKSEPEPDLAVTARSIREYTTNPSPQELRLVIEISDSTLEYDLHVKAPIYARAEIVEYWVIDIPGRQVHVHRAPALGVYTSIVRYGFADNITPLAGADALFCMERL